MGISSKEKEKEKFNKEKLYNNQSENPPITIKENRIKQNEKQEIKGIY